MSATLQLTSPQSNMSSSLRSILDNEEDYFKGSPKPSFDPRRRRNGNTSGYASPITTTPSSPRVQSSASSFTDRAFESPRMVPSAVMSPRIAQQQQQQEETDNEEFVTPSHSRRGSFSESNGYSTSSLLAKLKKFQDPIDTAVEDDEEESNSDNVYEAPSFDPRQLRRRNGDLNKPPQQEQHRIPSPDSYEFDEQEEEDLFINKIKSQSPPIKEQKEESKKQTVPERSLSRGGITGGTFDYQSFGLKGLAQLWKMMMFQVNMNLMVKLVMINCQLNQVINLLLLHQLMVIQIQELHHCHYIILTINLHLFQVMEKLILWD